MEEEMLTSAEARRIFGLSDYQITRLVKEGDLPAYRMGTARNAHLRFRRADIEAWLQRRRVPVAAR